MAQTSPSQPKISQKLLIRTVLLLFVLAALFAGYRYVETQKNDFNFGSSSAAGIMAAIKRTDDGSEAVLIEPDGTIKGTDSYKAGVNDRNLAWRPDGRFLFFTSDRAGNTFHVYRWNPDQSDAEARTVGSRGRTNPTFPADEVADANDDMLIISGGTVQSLDPRSKQSPQLLPPNSSTITNNTSEDQEGGSEAMFEALYGKLGTSFSYARWCKGNRYIAAIMKRDGGEVLVMQDMTLKDGKLPKILPVVAGDHVEFDVNPKDGSVVFSVQGFQWPDADRIPPEYLKGNRVTIPFKHLVGFIDPEQGGLQPIIANKDDSVSFGAPSVSPDGSKLLVTSGPYDASSLSLTPKGLISLPVQKGGAQALSRLLEGEIYEPTWSKDGSLIAFAMRVAGKRDLYTIHSDGSSQINLTGGKGDFSNPCFNPQVKAGTSP